MRVTRRRCHRRIVAGVTRKADQRAGKRSAQDGEDRTVGGSEFRSLDLAAQHTELVAQHRDLDVLGVLALEAPEQHTHESPRHEVEEGQGHRRIMS